MQRRRRRPEVLGAELPLVMGPRSGLLLGSLIPRADDVSPRVSNAVIRIQSRVRERSGEAPRSQRPFLLSIVIVLPLPQSVVHPCETIFKRLIVTLPAIAGTQCTPRPVDDILVPRHKMQRVQECHGRRHWSERMLRRLQQKRETALGTLRPAIALQIAVELPPSLSTHVAAAL